jgi:hypothetical protein
MPPLPRVGSGKKCQTIRVSDDEVVATYVRFLDCAVEAGSHPIELEFKKENHTSIVLTIANEPPSERRTDFSTIRQHFSAGSIELTDTSAAILKYLTEKRLVQKVEPMWPP